MSRRRRPKKIDEAQATEGNSGAQLDAESKTLAQTMELVNKIRGITESIKPTDLENISNKLDKLEDLSMIREKIDEITGEFASLSKYAKIFFGIGAAALLIYCINGVVTLLNTLRPK